MTAAHDATKAVLASGQNASDAGKIAQSEAQPTMTEELKIEISDLPEETAKLILSAVTAWECTPSEAARRLLNELANPKA